MFYIKITDNEDAIYELLAQAHIPHCCNQDCNMPTHVFVNPASQHCWGGSKETGADASSTIYTLPEDQATVYQLLNLLLPNNMQQEFNVGDILTYISAGTDWQVVHTDADGFSVGYLPPYNDGNFADYEWRDAKYFRLKKAALTQANTIYLTGTPGQLEGFRQDWVKAGNEWDNRDPLSQGIRIDFPINKPAHGRGSYKVDRTAYVPVIEHWQSLLDRAAQHMKNQNVAPVKIAGHEVKLEEDRVVIGCRKKLTKTTVINVADALAVANANGARIESVRTADNEEISLVTIQQLAEWLKQKSK